MDERQASMNNNDEDQQPLYVLMTKDYRVSRSRRAKWFINNYLSRTTPSSLLNEDDTEDEMTVLPAPTSPPVISPQPVITPTPATLITPTHPQSDTGVFFISHYYSIVFVLDMTSTMLQVSNETFCIKLDEATQALNTLLEQLKNPMKFHGTEDDLSPQLCVSILAYSGDSNPQKHVEVLVQGADLNKDTISDIVYLVKTNILRLENKKASNNYDIVDGTRADNCLERMVKAGLLGVQLLPRGAMKGLVILTDGIGGFATPTSMYSTVNQLRTANISCWVVLCGGGMSPSLSLGSIPDTQAVAFLTEACNGCVIDPAKLLASADDNADINSSQKCILFWSLQVSSWRDRTNALASLVCESESDPFVPQSLYTQHRNTITLPLTTLIGCRTREGFFIQSIMTTDNQLEIVLTYPWQPDIIVNYSIRATLPVTMASCPLLVTLSFIAPYPFVRDFQSDLRTLSGPHSSALRRFKQTLKSLTHSDTFLSHSTAFSSNIQFYTLPKSIGNTTPLFYNQPNQSKPVPSQGLNDKSSLALCKYWTPLCSLDINIWPKWFHTDKIVLILSQDSALPPHLLYPSSSGRYSTLQCRVAALKLFTCLRSWCSVVLLENLLFLKFLPIDSNPLYFCAVRIAQMQSCVLVHIGFIEGTPRKLQLEILSDLNTKIRNLTISLPLKDQQRPPVKGRKKSSRPPQQPCTTIIRKQLQKALISYDLPLETLGDGGDLPIQLEYLNRYEWQWGVPHQDPDLLMGLLQQRLKEGFLIASASNGIVTLVAQIEVKQPSSTLTLPSLVQYVMFPYSQVGVFSCEIWVEPQYLIVSNTPLGLEYLKNENTVDIPYKIHSKDIETLTQITTFLEYSPKVPSHIATPTTGNEEYETTPSSLTSLKSKLLVQEVQSDLSSLYSKSHITALTFSAFTESLIASNGPVTLADCSSYNRFLNKEFQDLLQQRLSSDVLIVREPHKLIKRLQESHPLESFVELYTNQMSSRLLWGCYVINDSDGLILVFTPCFVICTDQDTPKQGTPEQDMPPNVFSFPLVILHTTLPHLLGDDSSVGGALPLPPDEHYNCMFNSPKQGNPLSSFDSGLFEKIKRIHSLAYLHALQQGLLQGRPLVTNNDLIQGLSNCTKAELTVNLTPLLLGVCHHCTIDGEDKVTLAKLSSLLETLGDQRHHAHSIRFLSSSSSTDCTQREKEISNLVNEFLLEKGLNIVEGCGYYWYKEEREQYREPSVCSTDDEGDVQPVYSASSSVINDNNTNDSDNELSNLDLIFTPPPGPISRRVSVHFNHAPLFICLRTVVSPSECDTEESQVQDTFNSEGIVSLCLDSLFPGDTKPGTDTRWTLSLIIQVFSLLEHHDETELEDKRNSSDPLFSIHSCFRPLVNSLKSKVEWLIKDELVSRARELFINNDTDMVPSSLLPSVTSHIQASVKKTTSCTMTQQPVAFVLGQNSTSSQFIQFLSTIEVPSLTIHKSENNYFYFTTVHQPHPETTPPKIEIKRHATTRSSTPTPLTRPLSFPKVHRRSASLTSDLSCTSTISSQFPFPRTSISSSMGSPLEEVTDSMYDASQSNSTCSSSSIVTTLTTPTSLSEVTFWLVLRVVPRQVEIYLHSRCSQNVGDEEKEKQLQMCSSITEAIRCACHKTNQWYLLKDLLDTHQCSLLLLPESLSAAWVEGTSKGGKEITMDGESFSSCQFACKLRWREHVTPHWRLKNMGNKVALHITNSALEAFAVTNREDVFVLQDVLDDGNEAIFYLKVSESVFVGNEGCYNNADSSPFDEQRCDTRATVEEDTISTLSYQRSSFDVTETPQLSHQMSASVFSLNSGTHESIVLELHGITAPSVSMTSRLQRLIQSKLDDKALEMMCSTFTRNQRLELSNADVQFLQEYPEKPSEVLSIPIPYWVTNPHALFYYILQQFNSVFTKPLYNTTDGPYDRLCVPPAVDKLLRDYNLPIALQQDLLSLYIRPMTRGRGIALISACLVSPEGNVVPLTLDILPATRLCNVPSYDEITNIQIIDEFPCSSDNFTVALHVWERGNVGMDELRKKLVSCVQFGIVDILMEIHYLQLPIASLANNEIDRLVSPGLLRRTNTISNRSSSASDSNHGNSFSDQSQRDIEVAVKAPVLLKQDSTGADWEEREKQRREQICRETLKQEAYMGQKGTMKEEYLISLSSFLTQSHDLGLPEIFHHTWQVPANYLIGTMLTQILSILSSSLASLLSTTELTFNIFKSNPNSFDYVCVEKSNIDKLGNGRYVIVGRDLAQWRETKNPQDCTVRNNYYWPNEQQHVPLSSWKQPDDRSVLLIATTKKHDTFIPRQRMVLAYLADGMFQLWMYNMIEDRVKEIKSRLTSLEGWQLKRSGFLYHLLSQKMGLFHHTGAKDISPLAQRASRHCKNINGVSALIDHIGPVSTMKQSLSSRGHEVELDRFYQDLEPPSRLTHPPKSDPITRHGLQFKDALKSQREILTQSNLLLKVFNTWDNPDRRNRIDQATPISSEIITKLKRTSRLLHYCSSSIWVLYNSYVGVGEISDTSNKQASSEDASSWFSCICEKFIAEYISYLQTLHFQSINERPSSKPKGQSTPQHSTTKYSKCLQRSWTGGIILIELSFEAKLFLVKLYSLELSRSSNLPPPSQDVSGLFSQECSRIKDFIHTHSFNYDFHIRIIHSIILGRLKVEGVLYLRNLLNEFCINYVNPPQYIRNRLCSDRINMTVTVPSCSLYTHILGHCSDYNFQTVDVIQTSGDGCGSSNAWDNCLMIDLRPGVIGTITTPELSQVIRETKDLYNVMVLAVPDVDGGEEPVAMELPLKIYMLLVNRIDMYPRLTIDSPFISSTRRIPDGSTISHKEDQSQLHDSVKFHRRKLGYGSLGSPSSVADMVFNPHLLKELMSGLKAHFTNIIKTAQNHVRRNELWKKLLYGGMSLEMPKLNFTEFQELLQLVTLSKLEHFDPMLSNLVYQSKKWYKDLLEFLRYRYGESFRLFTSGDNSIDQFAVIINEGWHDMFIMVESTSHQHGLYTIYRKPHEGGTPFDERKITSNIEAEQLHINEFVNCLSSFLWADIINHTQSLSPKLRHSREK